MDRQEKLLAISQLVFELSITSSNTADLDALLERLFGILCTHREFSLQPRGAVVLLNPRGRYFQVAQFGMAPGWKSDFRWDSGMFGFADISETCVTETIAFQDDDRQKALLLPLRIDGQGAGYAVLFTAPDYQPTDIHLDFMNDLARALSGLVQRALTSETLRIRELELEEARADALRSLGVASEYRDNETGWHIMRMTNFAQAIAKAMDLPAAQRELLYVAAPMHDVGKIGIADAVLLKPGKFTPEEYETMKTHTQIGVTILAGNDALIAAARDIAGSHHERWDGKGYPNGLAGEDVALPGRILVLAEVYDALAEQRSYKPAWPLPKIVALFREQAGKQFDPDLAHLVADGLERLGYRFFSPSRDQLF